MYRTLSFVYKGVTYTYKQVNGVVSLTKNLGNVTKECDEQTFYKARTYSFMKRGINADPMKITFSTK